MHNNGISQKELRTSASTGCPWLLSYTHDEAPYLSCVYHGQEAGLGLKQQEHQAMSSPSRLRPSIEDLLKRVSELEHSSQPLQEVSSLANAIAKVQGNIAAAEQGLLIGQQQVKEDVIAMGLELQQVSILPNDGGLGCKMFKVGKILLCKHLSMCHFFTKQLLFCDAHTNLVWKWNSGFGQRSGILLG